MAATCGFVVDNNAWNPQRPIDDFLSTLQEKGFLIIGGWLGTPCYKNEPSLKMVDETEVYAWKKGDFDEDNGVIAHTIIVIGASKKGYAGQSQDLVYFMDPYADDDKIYMTSYESFRHRAATVEGLLNPQKPEDHAFFYSHPQLKPTFNLTNNNHIAANSNAWFSCNKTTALRLIGAAAVATTAVVCATMLK